MKTIIQEQERGFLFQNGRYKAMIQPGVCRTYAFLGQKLNVDVAEGIVQIPECNMKILLKDEAFQAVTATAEVPDNHIAFHRVDGRLTGILASGMHCFWNIFENHTFQLVDISQPDASAIAQEYFNWVPSKYYTKIEVSEGESALLYFDGAFQKQLGSGVHYFWNYKTKVTHQKMDLRLQQQDIPGQEILTSDKVSLRINFLVSYRILDAVSLTSRLKDYNSQIYTAVQLTLRQYIGRYRLDELLDQKEEISSFVLKKLREQQDQFYIEFQEAGIRDIILPGEIRDIMNTVLVAEKTAQANVIARREEVASTRSLLNTAKLLEENDTLRRLKEMEYMERICDRVGSITVGANGGLLDKLQELVSVR